MSKPLTVEAAEAALAKANKRFERALADKNSIVARRAGIEHKIAMVDDALKPHAFAAATGDKTAANKVAVLNADKRNFEAALADLASALDEADKRIAEARIEAQEAEDQTTLARAHEAGEEYVRQAQRVDDALAIIVDAMKKRSALYEELARSKCLPDPTRLICQTRWGVAIRAAGAGVLFMRVPALAGSSADSATLAQSDSDTLASLALRWRPERRKVA